MHNSYTESMLPRPRNGVTDNNNNNNKVELVVHNSRMIHVDLHLVGIIIVLNLHLCMHLIINGVLNSHNNRTPTNGMVITTMVVIPMISTDILPLSHRRHLRCQHR